MRDYAKAYRILEDIEHKLRLTAEHLKNTHKGNRGFEEFTFSQIDRLSSSKMSEYNKAKHRYYLIKEYNSKKRDTKDLEKRCRRLYKHYQKVYTYLRAIARNQPIGVLEGREDE